MGGLTCDPNLIYSLNKNINLNVSCLKVELEKYAFPKSTLREVLTKYLGFFQIGHDPSPSPSPNVNSNF